MNWVSNLNRVIFAVLLLGFVAGTAQAGDGLFGRLRNKACRTKCAPVLTCEQLCIQKCYETYCKRVQLLEQYRCTKPDVYAFGIRMAKLGYCKSVNECRNPCISQTAQTTLALTNVRTTESLSAEGNASNETDILGERLKQ